MATLILVVFFLCFILLLCSLAGLVRPSWLNLETRKDVAKVSGALLVLLFILGPFLPDTDTEPASPQAEQAQPTQPVCEDLTDRMERLECAYQRAMRAWTDSSTRISDAHRQYLTTACPSCSARGALCVEALYARTPGNTDPLADAEYDQCMKDAWPESEWPQYEAIRKAFPAPKIPPELSAHWRDIQRRTFSGP